MAGRPKIDREREARIKRIAKLNEGIIACYETIEMANRKKQKLEALNAIPPLPENKP